MKLTTPILVLALLLGALTVACYWPITRHGFVALDDPQYIDQNPHIQQGISVKSIGWAFTTGHASNWHPMTWISHMLDCQLFGSNAGGHHFTNLFLHAINTVMLFLLLKRMTGAFWRSALVAGLFAWHPLHVESVAWASERKDVLSTFFFLLTLIAYSRYATGKGRGAGGEGGEGSGASGHIDAETWRINLHYLLALAFFALGLMSKPMVVTLPCVLLLLDFWPLGRLQIPETTVAGMRQQFRTLRPLLREKIPFFGLSLGASLVTYFVQKAGGAVSSLDTIPVWARVANAIVAYVRYLSKTVWPVDLAVFYPLPDHWPFSAVLLSALLLLILSALFLCAGRRYPYLLIGWLWFIGTLVPTIGLVQVGSQSMADRYTYIPSIGVFVIVAWGLSDLQKVWSHLRLLLPCSAAVALAACLAATSIQIGYWRNNETLFRHAMEAAPDNYLAYDHMAKVCEANGRTEEALAFYSALLKLKPRYPEGNYNFGTLLMGVGKLDEAERHFREALKYRPQFAQAHSNLGNTLLRCNKPSEAVDHFESALRLSPMDPDAHLNLGVAFFALDRAGDAAKAFSNSLRLAPDVPQTQFLLALALSRDNKPGEAAVEAEKARKLAAAKGQQEIAAKADELLASCRSSLSGDH